jgi:hypothetical protein
VEVVYSKSFSYNTGHILVTLNAKSVLKLLVGFDFGFNFALCEVHVKRYPVCQKWIAV